ncbi:hypothetical protein [Nocardia carnea]|uniref:hypothetical protein n=1 Tax=Nocardia carnea TaxID=37328 RepID=UPI002453DD3D|nr:hypothetical protein [Nocardia carnea]
MNDPVDDISNSAQQFVNAFGTATNLFGFLASAGREQRAAAESALRIQREDQVAAARIQRMSNDDRRSQQRHALDMLGKSQKYEDDRAATWARTVIDIAEAQHRAKYRDLSNNRAADKHEAEMGLTEARTATAQTERRIKRADFRRRNRESEAEEARKNALHNQRLSNARNEGEFARELHKSRIESIELQNFLRLRAAGLADTLSDAGMRYDSKLRDAAAFAAAVGTSATGGADFKDRLRGDAGVNSEKASTDGGASPSMSFEEAINTPEGRLVAEMILQQMAEQAARPDSESGTGPSADDGASINESVAAAGSGAESADLSEPSPPSPGAEHTPGASAGAEL